MVGPSVGLARLRRWMSRRNVTQLDLASRLGMSGGQCSAMIHGCARPSLDQASMIEDMTSGYVKMQTWAQAHEGELPVLPERRGRKKLSTGNAAA